MTAASPGAAAAATCLWLGAWWIGGQGALLPLALGKRLVGAARQQQVNIQLQDEVVAASLKALEGWCHRGTVAGPGCAAALQAKPPGIDLLCGQSTSEVAGHNTDCRCRCSCKTRRLKAACQPLKSLRHCVTVGVQAPEATVVTKREAVCVQQPGRRRTLTAGYVLCHKRKRAALNSSLRPDSVTACTHLHVAAAVWGCQHHPVHPA